MIRSYLFVPHIDARYSMTVVCNSPVMTDQEKQLSLNMELEKFDFESFKKEAIAKLRAGKGLSGSEEAFTLLIKSF